MKSPQFTGCYDTATLFTFTFEKEPMEVKGDGGRHYPPAPGRQSRPISVQSDQDPASYTDSGLPSSLKDWLLSKSALVISWPSSEELDGQPLTC